MVLVTSIHSTELASVLTLTSPQRFLSVCISKLTYYH